MPLMTYKSCPGACGLQVVPDLATGPGVVSDNGLTWTFHIQPNVKFEDGTVVTSQDVKYAIERTYDRTVAANGPPTSRRCSRTRSTRGRTRTVTKKMGLTAVTTPNATTIVFHLVKPFADFDLRARDPGSAPVPPNKDTGATTSCTRSPPARTCSRATSSTSS